MSNPVQQFFAALNERPDNLEAMVGLHAALAEERAWPDIALTIPRFARKLSSPAQRGRFLFLAAYTARHLAHNDEQADELLEEALGQEAEPAELAAGFREAFEAGGDWRAFVTAAMDAVEATDQDPVKARLFNQIGRIYEDKLYERERAITCYQRAFKLDPKFTEPLRSARAIYAHADQWSTVAKLYQIELRVTEDPRQQGRLLKELGYVELERLGDRERAAETLRQAALVDPELSGVAQTISALESDEEAHGVIVSPRILQSGAEATVSEEEDDADATEEDTEVAADDTAEEEATEEEATEEEATEEEATEDADAAVAEEAAEADDDDAEVAEEAAEADEPDEDDAETAQAADAPEEAAASDEAEALEEDAEDETAEPEEGADGASDEVAEAEAPASEEETGEAGETETAESEDEDDASADDTAAAASMDSDVDEAVSGETEAVEEAPPAVRPVQGAEEYLDTLVLETAEIDDPAVALGQWAWAIELGARIGRDESELADWVVDAIVGQTDGLAAMKAVLPPLVGRRSVWSAVAERLRAQADDGVEAAESALYGVLFYGLGDAKGAADYASAAGPVAAAEAAAKGVAKKGNWRKAHAALTEAMVDVDGDPEVEAYRAQAYLALGMGKEDKATDSLRRVLRKEKKDVSALFFIKALYRRDEKWGPLAEAIKTESSLLPETATFRLGVAYRDLIAIYRDHLPQPTNVLASYKQLVEVDPTDVEVLDDYAALLEELNRAPELVQVLRMKADAVSTDAEKIAIHEEVATLFLDRFNNQPEAITSYEAILALDPDHTGALGALEELYMRRRLWEPLIDVKRKLVALADEDETRVQKLLECADLAATRMRDKERAVALYAEVLDINDSEPTALEALERLYEREKDWEALAGVLAKRVYVIEDEQERALALMKLGQIQSDRLGSTEASVQTYEELLAIDPENFRAKDSLKKAYIELENWDALEAFFASQDAWAEYVRQLESLAGTLNDEATQVDLLFRAADVWDNKLEDEARATKALERVLSIDETNYTAAIRLAPVYEERSDFKRLPPLLEVILEREEDPAARFGHMVKLARIAKDRQRDAGEAFRWFSSALDEQPHRVDILDELEEVAGEAGEWESLEQTMGAARARIADDEEQREAWLALTQRLGSVYDTRLDDPESALACFDEVLAVLPGDVAALDAKDAIFSRQEAWDALLDVITAKQAQATTDAARVALWERACLIHEEHRGDVDAAILGYQEVLAIDPNNAGALEALRRLYRETGESESLAEVLRSLVALRGEEGDAAARRSLRIELAQTNMDALGQAGAAAEVLEAVVAETPGDLEARDLLERLLAEDDERLRVAKILEPLYEADGAWAKLVDDLEIQLDASTDDETACGLLARIGALQRGRLEDHAAATDAYARLLRRAPGDASAQAAVESIAEDTGDWVAVTELYESLLAQLDPTDAAERALAVDLGTRAAEFFDTRLDDVDEAVRLHRRVLEVDPAQVGTLETLDALFRRSGQWQELLGVIDERLVVTESSEDRRALHFQAAVIWREELDSPNEAIDEYRKVLDLFPSDPAALEALDALYGDTADSASRAEIVEQRAALAEDGSAEQLGLQNRLARIYEDELGEVPRAMALWQQVLAVEPTNTAALDGLEAQLQSEDYAVAASEILEPLYNEQSAPERLARLLETRLSYVDAPEERKALYHRIATLHEEESGDAVSAYGVLARAAEEFLHEDDVVDRMAGLAGTLGNWPEFGDTIETLATEHADPIVARNGLVRVAKVREEKIGDVEAAATLWRQVLEDNPGDREALDALERIDAQLEVWDELVDVLLRKAELPDIAQSPAAMKPLLFRAASIQEHQLERPDEAIDVLRTVQLHDPADRDAIQELERLFTQTARWEDLVENYQRKLDLADSDSERRDLLATMGVVLEKELEDPDRAVAAYRQILDVDPTDLSALQSLDRLFVSTEAWYELLEVLRKEVDLVESADQRRNILFRIGRLHERELMDFAGAVDVYRSILEEDASHAPTRDALQAMIDRGDEAMAAAQILEPIYRSEGLWTELVLLNRTRIDFAPTAEVRRDIHVDIAQIMERQLSDADGAIEALSAAAREETRSSELAELERLAPVTEAWSSICDLFVELWDEVADPVLRAEVGGRVARIREEELGDVDGAIASYVRLQDEDPTATSALQALDRLYQRSGDSEALADVLQRRVFAAGDSPEATTLRLRLASVYSDDLGEAGEAITVYREVLAADPSNETAVGALKSLIGQGVEPFEISSILDPLFRSQERWGDLVELNQTRIMAEDSPDERYRLWMDTADVNEQQLGDKAEALNALGNALFEAPADVGLKDRIEALGGEIDYWGVVADVYDMLLQQELGDHEQLDVALRLARIREQNLGEVDAAESAYVAALEVEPGSVVALRALDTIYTRQERWGEVAGILGRLRECVFDPAELVPVTYRHACILRDQLRDGPAAIAVFQEVLDADPNHRESLDALIALYGELGEWEALFDTYERVSLMSTDEEERTAVTIEMAKLATDRLDRPMDAIDLWQNVRMTRPSDVRVLASLAGLYERTEQYSELAEVVDRQVELSDDPEETVGLLRRSATLWSDVLDNPDQAIARFQRVLTFSPGDVHALSALRGLYELVGDSERLVGCLEQLLQLGVVAEEEQVDVYRQLGALYADVLMQPAPAIDAWEEVSSRDPSDEEALDRLEMLYGQDARWSNVVGVIERKVARAESEEDQIDLLKRMADVCTRQLQDDAAAAAAYERVLELDLGDFDATAMLEDIYTRTERWQELAALCVDRLDVTEDPFDRVQLLRRAAGLYEQQLDQPDAAFLIVSTAAQEAPNDDDLRQELERLAAVSGKEEELVKTYDGMVQRLSADPEEDPANAIGLLMAKARVLATQLGRPADAEATYEQVLGLDPEQEPALAALETIHTESESWVSLVGVLRRRVNVAFDTHDQVQLHRRIGELFETKLDDNIEAVEAYKMVIRLDDTDTSALDALERIYESEGQWRDLVEVLERKAENTFEPDAQVALHFRMGEIWQSRLGVAERAVESFKRVLDHDPSHRASLHALEALYAGLDKWERFLEIVDAQLTLATDDGERIQLFGKQALVYEQHFDDVDAAIGAHMNILTLDPKDLEAIQSLERIFMEQERVVELTDAYQRHVAAVDEPHEKCDVLTRMAQVQVELLDDAHAAIDTYTRVLEIDPNHAEALTRIGALYEHVEHPEYAVQAYERLAGVTDDMENRLRLLYRSAQLLRGPIGDAEGAEQRYLMCIEQDEAFLPALEALEQIYTERGDTTQALDMLQRQTEFARDLPTRSALMVRQAAVFGSQLGDTERAIQLYQDAIELDPTNVGAATPLSGLYFQAEDWVRAKPLYDLQMAGVDALDDEAAKTLFYRSGVVAQQLGFHEEAADRFERTLAIEVGHLGALRGLATLYSAMGREDDAYQAYVDILAEHRGSMEPAEAVECYFQAGTIKAGQGDGITARQMYANALEIMPDHEPSLRRMLALVEESGDKRAVVELKQRLLPTVSDNLERFKLLVEIGDGHLELNAPVDAEAAYREAVQLDPTSKVVLHKLLNIFTDTGNWRRATEVLGQLARMEENPDRLARLCNTIAVIFRDELGEADQAVYFFNEALDAKYDFLEPFEAIDQLLTQDRNWEELERNYRKMIGRVVASKDPEMVGLNVMLLRNLGEIYRSRLERPGDAIEAYRAATNLAPDDKVLLSILAELLERTGAPAEQIIEQHQRLIAVDPFRIDSYRALFGNYAKQDRYDAAWCMASALSLLQKAQPAEEQFYSKHLPQGVNQAKREISNRAWRELLYHQDLDRNITQLFEVLSAQLRPLIRRDVKTWGVHKRKDKIDLSEEMPFTKMMRYAMGRVGVNEIGLYEKADGVGLLNMGTDPVALLVGRDMLSGKSQRELAFQVVKSLTLMRPEFYLASAYPSTEYLKAFFFAAVAAVKEQIMTDENQSMVQEYAHEIRALPAPVFEQIRRAVNAIFDSGVNPNMSAWLRHVDYTANRAGLLLCGDLRTAAGCMRAEADRGQAISKGDVKDSLSDLILFSISEPFFELRNELGLSLRAK